MINESEEAELSGHMVQGRTAETYVLLGWTRGAGVTGVTGAGSGELTGSEVGGLSSSSNISTLQFSRQTQIHTNIKTWQHICILTFILT